MVVITLTHVIGMVFASTAGAIAGELTARIWPLARLGRLGPILIGAFTAAPFALLLQFLGAGEINFKQDTGLLDWTPILSILIMGAVCGIIFVGSIGLMRVGGRSHR